MSIPTEILGISKLYSISSRSNSETYIRIVKTLQELKILDVTHVVSRGLEEDPSGSWSALKKATDDDFAAAKKFVDDLNTFLTSLERLIDSLDVSTPKDGFDEKFVDFLSGKTADGLTAPTARNSSISGVILGGNAPGDGLTNVDLISLLLHEIRIRSTGVEDSNGREGRAAFELLRWLGQTEPYDYNSPGTNRSPKNYISRYASEYSVNPLELCVHALSNTFNLSAGINRLKRIQSEVGLSVSSISDADKVFDGVRVADIEKYATSVSNVFYQRSLAGGSLGSTTYALKVARYDDGLNKIAPCEKPINITPETRYTSGETSLIRDSLAENDFNFQKLGLYDAQLESSLDQLQKVTESLVGFMDTENELTPFAVLSKILESSIAALTLAGKDDLNKYQLLALTSFAAGSGADSIRVEEYLVRSVAGLKDNRTKKVTGSKADSESSKSTVTLTTSRTSTGSDSVQPDAEVKTVEAVSSTSDAADSGRVITRAASSRVWTTEEITNVAKSMFGISSTERLDELEAQLRAASSRQAAKEEESLSTGRTYLEILAEVATGTAYESDIEALEAATAAAQKAYDEELVRLVTDTTNFFLEATSVLIESKRKEGTIFSLIVDLYDDFTTKSKNSVGENEKITDSMGYTNYGKMDEYAILSLIISCFSQIFDLVMPSNAGFAGTSFNFGAAELGSAMNIIRAAMTTGGDVFNTQIDSRLYAVRKYVETYQNCYAFLDAYLKNIRESRLLAISNLSEVSKDPIFTSDVGRLKSLANVTSHSVALRRALLRKWEPIEASGYLSKFSSTVVPVDSYIKTLRSSKVPNTYEDNSLQNMRVLHVGVPASTIVSDSVGRTQFINVVVGKLDHRYYLSDTFIEKSFIFDPALFAGDLGIAATGLSSRSGSITTFYFFDRNGSSGPYSYDETLSRYLEVNPGADRNVLESVILNCYNSAMIEAYQYYTSGIVLDESTATGVDTSISPAGLSALSLLSGLNLPDVSLPPGAAISSAFSDGHINFEETASGLSSSKKDILSNVASSYLFKSNRILDRIARNFDHDRVFLIPVDPDSFEVNSRREFIDTFGSQNLVFRSATTDFLKVGAAKLTDQDPTDNGMMAGGFYAQILEYTIATANITESSAFTPAGLSFEIDTLAERARLARVRELLGDPRAAKSTLERAVDQASGYAANAMRRTKKIPAGGITSDDAKKAPATMKKFNPKKRG